MCVYILWWSHISKVPIGVYLQIYTYKAGWHIYTSLQLGEYIYTNMSIHNNLQFKLIGVMYFLLHMIVDPSGSTVIEGRRLLSINCIRPPLWWISSFLLHVTMDPPSSTDKEVYTLLSFMYSLLKIEFIDHVQYYGYLDELVRTSVQFNSMSWQRSIKHSYKLFSLLHNPPYILVWHPHSICIIWTMATTVYLESIWPLSSVIGSLPLINPLPFRLRVYQW